MKLQPLNDYIAVIETKLPEKVGRIIIPNSVKEGKFKHAKVVGVGEGRLSISGVRVPPSVKVGDTVIFEKTMGFRVELPDQHYIILGEDSILAKVEE